MCNSIRVAKEFKLWVDGDDRAFKPIFEYFYPLFCSVVLKVTSNHEVAEELSMNAMMKVWELRAHTGHINKFDDYLFGILRQQIAGYLRKKNLQTIALEGLEESEHMAFNDSTNTFKELMECYLLAIEKLSPQQKKIFLMSREEFMSNREIGDKLGLSVHTVNNHIKASLKVIRAEFQDIPDEAVGLIVLAIGITLKV